MNSHYNLMALPVVLFSILFVMTVSAQSYKIVDTGQNKFFNNRTEISEPAKGTDFYGQDAHFTGNEPSYKDNEDGTVTDLVTGLMWLKSADMNKDGIIDASDKRTFGEAVSEADTLNFAGYNDWRVPTIKELYSLIIFSGKDPSGWNGSDKGLLVPFIDSVFAFGYGDENAGERIIDAQYVSSTKYDTTTMRDDETAFGVNFADGRIKGYGLTDPRGGEKTFYVKYVRGNSKYGINSYTDNGDSTITDKATGLMWQQSDSKTGLNWQKALEWVSQKNSENYLGYSDWRLPNVKELQSIVDYTRTPSTTNSAAIDPLFTCTEITNEGGAEDYPYYWSGTTHENMVNGGNAAYISFGRALGWMQFPPTFEYQLLDVHGAGCQRSDPKTGDPADYPYGRGPQGDVIRIYNYVRLVRNADNPTSINEKSSGMIEDFNLEQNYPNPFNPSTTIEFTVPNALSGANAHISLKVFNSLGAEVATLINETKAPGNYKARFDASGLASGIYIYRLSAGEFTASNKMILLQ